MPFQGNTMRTTDSGIAAEEVGGCRQAAILFAAGFTEAARALLAEQVSGAPRDADRRAFLMLLELDQVAQQRARYDEVAQRYADVFDEPAPALWDEAAPIQAMGALALEGVLSGTGESLARLAAYAESRSTVALDAGRLQKIEFECLAALTRLLSGLAAGGKRIIFGNVSELQATLLETAGTARHAMVVRRKAVEAESRRITAARKTAPARMDLEAGMRQPPQAVVAVSQRTAA
jgi:hypothetical protein